MLGNIISKVLAGAVVGYATNYLAIQMLFKEYFRIHYKPLGIRFGLGGVIVKERQQFESKISQLVESDVIHHRAIDQELRKPEFEEILRNVVSDLFHTHLKQALGPQLTLSEVPCLENSFTDLKNHLLLYLQGIAPESIHSLLQDVKLEKLLSASQIEQISGKLSQLAAELLQNEDILRPVLSQFIQEINLFSLKELIPEQILNALQNNLPGLFQDFHETLRYNYADRLNALVDQTKENLDLDELILKISREIAQKRLHEVFSVGNIENVPKAILENIQNLFQSDVSDDIIQTLLKFILNVLQEEKATVFELLSDDLKGNFESFLEKKLPDMLNTLVPWIRQKKAKLEQLIQHSFKDNTSSFGQLLASIFLGNVGKYVGVEEKLIELIEKQDVRILSQRASSYLLDYLKNNTIGDIVRRFDQEKILDNLIPVLKNQITQSITRVEVKDIANIFDKPIANWFSEQRLHKALTDLLDSVIEQEAKQKWIFTPKLDEFIQTRIHQELHKIRNSPLSTWLKPEKTEVYAQNFEKNLLHILKDNLPQIEDFIAKNLHHYVLDKKISLPEKDIDWDSLINNNLGVFLNTQFQSFKDRELVTLVDQLTQSGSTDHSITQAIKNYLLENLPSLMQGRIEALVQENLAKQPDTKLKEMVYKAMGEELAPLSLFGGLLGAITGFMLLAMPEFKDIGILMIVSGVAYGITGWGTNWLAIKMLFRPYHPIKLFGSQYTLPFTPGVIAKHKPRFAASMGRFIGDRLLNQENLQENFAKNQPRLEENFKDLFSKNEYAFSHQLLEQNQERLAANLANASLDQIIKQELKIRETVKDWVKKQKDWQPGEILDKLFDKQVTANLNDPNLKNRSQEFLYQQLLKWLAQKYTLKDILPLGLTRQLLNALQPWVMEEIRKFEQRIEVQDILDLANFDFLEKKINEFIQKNLEEILNDEQEENLKNQVFDFIQSKIQSDAIKQRIFSFIDDKLSDEFAPGKSIKDFFGGRLLEMIENNLNQILERVIQLAVNWMQKNKEDIANTVYNQALSQNALAWTYKNSIIRTTQDLIEKGIPNFLQTEFGSLQKMIHTKVKDLGESPFNTNNFIALDKESIKSHIDRILQNPKLLRKTRQLTNLILEERIFKIPLNALIKDDSTALVEHLRTILNPEIEIIQQHLRTLVDDEAVCKRIAKPFAALFADMLKRNFLTVHSGTLLKGVNPADLALLSDRLLTHLFDSKALENLKKSLIEKGSQKLSKQSLDSLISVPQIQEDIDGLLKELLHDTANQQLIHEQLAKLFQELFRQFPEKVRPETKDFLIHTTARAIFMTLENNVLVLVNSLNFKAIVVREIENMHAKELEDLFYGFAHKYFKYLIGYGFIFGIIFGLIIDFGLIAFFAIF